ncbi:MAG: hypothetical protein RL757_2373 [Bacteroidota bacterium]|jgi:hypothetical protein
MRIFISPPTPQRGDKDIPPLRGGGLIYDALFYGLVTFFRNFIGFRLSIQRCFVLLCQNLKEIVFT